MPPTLDGTGFLVPQHRLWEFDVGHCDTMLIVLAGVGVAGHGSKRSLCDKRNNGRDSASLLRFGQAVKSTPAAFPPVLLLPKQDLVEGRR